MTGIVVDASTALAWCFPDEASEYADGILVSLEKKTMLVPAVWGLEITNAFLVGERKKRLTQPDIKLFLSLIESLSFIEDVQSVGKSVRNVFPLAREYGLTAYDASYLELAIRHGVPLATLDGKLRNAAKQAGVKVCL